MRNARILFADDSKTIRTIVASYLREAGYEVILAEGGEHAIELARTGAPDLAILDIVMPGKDGYEVCDSFKGFDGPLKDIPIIFLTSVHSQALEVLGREFGAYLKKPVDRQLLLQTVEDQLAICRRVP